MPDQQSKLCPSSRCAEGSLVLGIVLADKTIAYADRRLRLDAGMASQIQAHATLPEKRFRFASTCIQAGCQQWSENKCGVIEEVIETLAAAGDQVPQVSLPVCSIRRDCRWFAQRGLEACHACPLIMTDNTPESSNEAPSASEPSQTMSSTL